MNTINPSPVTEQIVELKPSYKIPLILILAAIPLVLIKYWISIPVALFGLFLMLQAVTIRLKFTSTDLDIYRSEKLIRRFPYSDWCSWAIFWKPVPILFYFKEVKSIHFLPILFEPNTLIACLEKYCPKQQ